MTPVEASRFSRRGIITGGLAGAGVVALEACGVDRSDVQVPDGIYARRVPEAPTEPGSSEWARVTPVTVVLDAQIIALPFKAAPFVPSITVSALHDGQRIAFRLGWDDAAVDDLTVQVDQFRDACAVLLAPGEGDQLLRTMGSATQPATLLQWKADWQRDVDNGVQGEAQVYPNRSVDVYPPLIADVPRDLTPADYVKAGATQWLPGLAVANPMSAATRATCVEKLTARSFGTVTSAPTQNAVGRGSRSATGWQVVVAKPLGAVDPDEMALAPGAVYTCAFALWSGADKDGGSRKSPSKIAYRLVLEG